jgi:hypothetical protein
MKPRYPESADERAARLTGVARRMRLGGGALESAQPSLPPAEVIERRIAAKLKAASPGDALFAKALAGKMATERYKIASSLITGEINQADLTAETMANLEAVIHVTGRALVIMVLLNTLLGNVFCQYVI